MGIGDRIRSLRLKAGLTQKDLAAFIGISQTHMSQLEMGKRRVDADWIPKIAQALKCRPEDVVSDTSQKANHDITRITDNIIFIPLLSDVTKACCGMGNGYEFPDETIERRIPVDLDTLGPISTAGLLSLKVEGDSMTGAKIYDGDIAIIAPEEESMSGNVVLVCYGPQLKWMIRWFYSKPDGTIVLKAANREYPDIEVTPEDVEMGWYVYVGKVVAYQGTPRNGM
jgi:SOS-response transcriptional repressor LexA